MTRSDTILHDLINSYATSEQLGIIIDAAAPLHARDEYGRTPIELAAYLGQNVSVLETLIKSGATVTRSDTILHDLINSYATVEQLRIIIDAEAPLHTRDQYGRTPIELAAYLGQNAEVLRLLIDSGAQQP